MNERIQQLDDVTILDSVSTFLLIVRVVDLVPVNSLNPIFDENIFRDDIKDLDLIICCLRIV